MTTVATVKGVVLVSGAVFMGVLAAGGALALNILPERDVDLEETVNSDSTSV